MEDKIKKFESKAEAVADKVGETGDGIIAKIAANWKIAVGIAIAFALIAIVANG
jgi:hypothetical protein